MKENPDSVLLEMRPEDDIVLPSPERPKSIREQVEEVQVIQDWLVKVWR